MSQSTAIAPALAAKSATAEIPIIFQTGADPVQFGLVDSLSRPKGNLTGVAILTNTLVPKQLELLHEVAPTATLVAWLVNSKNPIAETDTQNVRSAVRILGQQVIVLDASNEQRTRCRIRNHRSTGRRICAGSERSISKQPTG
jgi:putative ABC transport system substrate-binding protein